MTLGWYPSWWSVVSFSRQGGGGGSRQRGVEILTSSIDGIVDVAIVVGLFGSNDDECGVMVSVESVLTASILLDGVVFLWEVGDE
jgi:hypothetical protein